MKRSNGRFALSGAAILLSTGMAVAQGGVGDMSTGTKNMNPAAQHKSAASSAQPGTNVPGATGVNPYSGKSVGVPLQPHDLGTPSQKEP